MSKLLKNMIIGIALGIVAAYFLSTEKGRKFQKEAAKAHEAYRENPAEYHQKARDRATEYTDLTIDTFSDYRQKSESGELITDGSLDTVEEKGKAAADFASEEASEFTSKVSEAINEAEKAKEETKTEADDIITDYTQDEEAPATEEPETTTKEADGE